MKKCGCKEKGVLKAKVFDVCGLAGYAEGSVVSRTVVDRPKGTVTIFAFDKGQGLSEHSAPFDALVQVVDGTGEFTIGGKAEKVSAGELVVMPAGIPHSVRAVKKFKMILTMIRA